MPMTVGDTLAAVEKADADAVIVVFRERESGAWRVGWSKMELASLCIAKEFLTHCVQDVVTQSYRESCDPD